MIQQREKEKKKKKQQSQIETMIFRIMEKNIKDALDMAMKDLFKGWK